MSQKTWVFTLNNYTETNIKVLDNLEVSYIVYGKEVGESGTPHLQGYIIFKRSYRLAQLKEILSTAHWEPAKAADAAANYCMKEGNFTIRDNRSQGKRNDIKDMVQDIDKEGLTNAVSLHPEAFVKYSSGFEKYARYTQRSQKRIVPKVYWLYGETGVGKTRLVYDLCSDLWCSSGDLRWFEGYTNQREALLDDFRKDHCTFSYLLRLLDRYPLKVPIKGSSSQWEPVEIYVTAPYKPEVLFVAEGEDISQLLRRITAVFQVTAENYESVKAQIIEKNQSP